MHIDCRGPRSAREALRDEDADADEVEEEATSGASSESARRGEAGGEDEEGAAVEAGKPEKRISSLVLNFRASTLSCTVCIG